MIQACGALVKKQKSSSAFWPQNRGGPHHICLVRTLPDIKEAVAALEARPARKGYAREMKINLGVDNKRQVGLFDPDGTRVR